MIPWNAVMRSIAGQGRWVLAVALLIAAMPALAEGPTRDFSVETTSFGMRIDQSRLLRRASNELEALAAFDRLAQPGTGLSDHALFQTMRDKIKRQGKSVTRRALRDQLLAATGLGQALSSGRSSGTRGRGLRFTLGVHSLRPEVGVKYRVGDASVRFRVDSSGAVGLGLSGVGAGRSGVLASFDGDDTFEFRARVGF